MGAEVQVVIAPFDVRQTNFIGGGINAITKSGTNTFKGSAYTYFQNQNMRGNSIDGEDLGARAKESKTIYGATFGGPIIKNKLFFFANVEVEKQPQQVIKWRARTEGEQPDENNYISRTTLSDMQKVSDFLRDKYGYDTGSATNFPADEKNLKLLGRIDWNITNGHKLSVRYNYTKNTAWNAVHSSVNYRDDQLTGCTDNRSVQMSSKHLALLISGTHMKMRIIFSIHCIDCTCQ